MRLLGGKIYYGWLALAAISGINFANSVTSIGMLTVFVLPMSDEFGDRKSTRLNSSHALISYAVFCLKKKKKKPTHL